MNRRYQTKTTKALDDLAQEYQKLTLELMAAKTEEEREAVLLKKKLLDEKGRSYNRSRMDSHGIRYESE